MFNKFFKKYIYAGILSTAVMACICVFSTSITFSQAANQRDVPPNATYGTWTRICSMPPGTPNIMCELTQTARAMDRPDISFRVSFIKLPQKQGILLRVIVPIRVELPMGIGIKLDGDKDMGNMPYRRCLGENCVAEALLSDKDMKNFLEGKNATFFLFTTAEEGIGGIIDLSGIKEGYNAMP